MRFLSLDAPPESPPRIAQEPCTIEAILFWRSVDGGALSQSAAQSEWDKLVAIYKADGMEHDFKGPEANPLRLRVHMFDDVDFRATQTTGKEART